MMVLVPRANARKPDDYRAYLKHALASALRLEGKGNEAWPLREFSSFCRLGVRANRSALTQKLILREWQQKKCYLRREMVDSMLAVTNDITTLGWQKFKMIRLPLPRQVDSENLADWLPS